MNEQSAPANTPPKRYPLSPLRGQVILRSSARVPLRRSHHDSENVDQCHSVSRSHAVQTDHLRAMQESLWTEELPHLWWCSSAARPVLVSGHLGSQPSETTHGLHWQTVTR